MTGWILLAEAAAVHSDRTFSLLKGGIDRLIVSPPQPGQVNSIMGSLIIRISTSHGDAGYHELSVQLVDENGQLYAALNLAPLPLEVSKEGRSHNFVLNITGMPVPPVGKYSFKARVDGNEIAQWPLEVVAQ